MDIMLLCCFFAVSCTKSITTLNVIPAPANTIVHSGVFEISGSSVSVDTSFNQVAKEAVDSFISLLSKATDRPSPYVEKGTIQFLRDTNIVKEGYRLNVRKNGVKIFANDANGVIYAIETMKQMLPPEIYTGEFSPDKEWNLPRCEINDYPRFSYRGLMLDVARHYFTVSEIKKVIDVMAMHKLNKFHWHLTDDQGWRIEIKKYSELTKIGALRSGTCIGRNFNTNDNIPYGGSYTQEEIKEVVAYAYSKGITVIPEIDLPGHMLAALATYPELGCTGGPYEVWHRWGVSEDVLCIGKEETFTFLENVLSEVCDLFPSEYIHIGGDECPKVNWEKCRLCQKRIKSLGLKDDEKHSAEHYLQSYVTERVGKFLASKGRKIIGWDEILEGKVPEGATIMSWRGSEGGIAAAKAGHDAIMSPTSHFYFDYYQSKDTDNEPLAIGAYLPVEQVYNYEMEIDAEYQKNIIGIQANMWTEYITTEDYLEYMIIPRLAALSEVQWCQSGVRDWSRFKETMKYTRTIYDALGYNYATHMFENAPDSQTM